MDPEKSKTGLVMKYFVLKPKGHSPYAIASRAAMEAYAFQIAEVNSQLAIELREWVKRETSTEGCECGYCNL